MSGRYDACEALTTTGPDGKPVRYRALRELPQGTAQATSGTTTVQTGEVDRLDLVAARTLGDPGQAWRIADMNDAIDPFALCRQPGGELRLP